MHPRCGGPRDVRLQHAGSRPTSDVLWSYCRPRRRCVEFIARPGNCPGDSLPANRERRPRSASHSPEWALSAPPIALRSSATRSQDTPRDASRSRFRISAANLPPHRGGDKRGHASATVPSQQVASKRSLPVRGRESRELLGAGAPLNVRLWERQGPTDTIAVGLKSDASATLSVGRSDYRCGGSAAQKKSYVSNRMQELRPNALTSTGCTSRTDASAAATFLGKIRDRHAEMGDKVLNSSTNSCDTRHCVTCLKIQSVAGTTTANARNTPRHLSIILSRGIT